MQTLAQYIGHQRLANKARPGELLMPVACVSHLITVLVPVRPLRKPKSWARRQTTQHQQNQLVKPREFYPECLVMSQRALIPD